MKTKNNTPILAISNLDFTYPGQLLFEDFNIRVNQRDIIGIIGPNGSGKSTLLQLMNGLLKATSGNITLCGNNLSEMTPRQIARKVAFVPQNTVVAHAFTAMEIVLMGRFPYKSMVAFENSDDIRIAREMLEITGATILAERRFDTLSGGEKQRVILASSLAQQPSLLLLDEPTASLDIFFQLHIFDTLKTLNRNSGMTIVAAIHDLNLAGQYCNRIWLLGGPQKFLDGPPEKILKPAILEPVFRVGMNEIAISTNKRWLIPELDRKASL